MQRVEEEAMQLLPHLHWGCGKRSRGATHACKPPLQALRHIVAPLTSFHPTTPSPQDSPSRVHLRDGHGLNACLNTTSTPKLRRGSQSTQNEREIGGEGGDVLKSTEKKHGGTSSSATCPRTTKAAKALHNNKKASEPTEKVDLDSFEWPRISISLSRKEKEEDFMAIKGTKLSQRPKRRLKAVERVLCYCSPGNWLNDITRGRYEVREKKSIRKVLGRFYVIAKEREYYLSWCWAILHYCQQKRILFVLMLYILRKYLSWIILVAIGSLFLLFIVLYFDSYFQITKFLSQVLG